MTKIDYVECTILSTPIIEMESPFYLSFVVDVKGDSIHATFIGDFARSLRKSLRIGDKAIIRNALIDHGKLIFDFLHLEPHTAIGRQADVYA